MGLSAQGYGWQFAGLAWFGSAWVGLAHFDCLGGAWLVLIKFKSFSQVPGNYDWSISSSEMHERISGSKLGCLQLPLLDETRYHWFGMSNVQDIDNPTLYP
jgi:hypothetical protein